MRSRRRKGVKRGASSKMARNKTMRSTLRNRGTEKKFARGTRVLF